MNIHKKPDAPREEGAKKSPFKIITNAKMVDKKGNPLPFEVAIVAKCVAHYRRQLKPLKTIWLCPAYWSKFDYWVRTHCLEREADAVIGIMTYDGVEIEKMPRHHIVRAKEGTLDIDWDFYPAEMKAVN